jgi:hypothetical protein
MLSTSTLNKFPKINSDILLSAIHKIEAMGPFYRKLKCSPEAYIAIKDYYVEEEHEETLRLAQVNERRKMQGKEPFKTPVNYWGSIFGIDILLDPDLKPGEWRFE